MSGAPGSYRCELFTFGFLRPRSAIIHWTVWCASGLSVVPAEQWLASTTVDSNGRLQREQCTQKSEQPPEAHRIVHSTYLVRHRTIRCHMKTKLQRSKPSEP
jgi:hypothetical protein